VWFLGIPTKPARGDLLMFPEVGEYNRRVPEDPPMSIITNILVVVFAIWAFCFLCSIPVLAALMRSSQLSRAEEVRTRSAANLGEASPGTEGKARAKKAPRRIYLFQERTRPGATRVNSPRRE
jgi:hypothetical protein